jgi:zinc protease
MRQPDPVTRRRLLERPTPGAPPEPRVPHPERITLPNGLRVVTAPWGALPQISLKLVFPTGAAHDPAGGAGTAGLVGRLLTEGAAALNADELNARLDRLGASLEVGVDHDFTEVELFLLSETLDESLALLADVVTRPTFPERELVRARDEILDGIAARADEPANVADDAAAAAIFGSGHPYGRPAIGIAEDVERIDLEAVRSFHHTAYRPAGAFLVVSGRFDPSRLVDRLATVFDRWTGEPLVRLEADPPVRTAEAGERITLDFPDAVQAELRVGGIGLERASPDWIPAAVANYLLGGSTITGRLGANLRERRGWTYGARSGFSAGCQPGGWMAETAVDVEVRDAALEEMLREIARMSEEPVPEAELDRAQRALMLSLPRAFETPGRVVNRLVTLESFGLPLDYWARFPDAVRAVDGAEVRRVSRRYLDVENLVSVMVA